MSLLALLLVVIAAFTHASWNLLAKRAAHCRHFNWYYSTGAALLFMPLAFFALRDFAPRVSVAALLVLLATCILHTLYSESLQRGYRVERRGRPRHWCRACCGWGHQHGHTAQRCSATTCQRCLSRCAVGPECAACKACELSRRRRCAAYCRTV